MADIPTWLRVIPGGAGAAPPPNDEPPGLDLENEQIAPHNDGMTTDAFRQEMLARFAASDARLEAAEARTQAAIERLSGSLDGRLGRIETEMSFFRDGFKSVDDEFKRADSRIDATLEAVRAEGRNTRWTIAALAIAMIGVAVAIWQVDKASQANMLAAFQAGLAAQAAHPPDKQ